MKNKKKIWKIVSAMTAVVALSCVVPACVVSCGSSANASSTTPTIANPTTNESDLVTTSVSGDSTVQSGKNVSNSYEYFFDSNDPAGYLPWFNFVYLNKQNSTYTISLSTNSNSYTYQWYQVPVSTLYSEFGIADDNLYKAISTNYPAAVKANASGVSFLASLVSGSTAVSDVTAPTFAMFTPHPLASSTAIPNATKPTYQFKYGTTLDDAIYFCKITNGTNTFYSQVTWLQAKTPSNPLDVSSYSMSASSDQNKNQENPINDSLSITNNTNVTLNLSMADSSNNEMTSDDFAKENYYALYIFDVFSELTSTNIYQIFNLNNSSAWNYTFNASTLNSGVSVAILNQNGQIMAPNSANSSYLTMDITNNDPLNLANAQVSLSTTASSTPVTNSIGESANEIKVKPNTKLTFTLNIDKFDSNDFKNTDYYIEWYVQNNTTYADEIYSIVPLSQASSWTYSFNAPSGISNFSIVITNGSSLINLNLTNSNWIINASSASTSSSSNS